MVEAASFTLSRRSNRGRTRVVRKPFVDRRMEETRLEWFPGEQSCCCSGPLERHYAHLTAHGPTLPQASIQVCRYVWTLSICRATPFVSVAHLRLLVRSPRQTS